VTDGAVRRVTAFAPAHVTGIFSPSVDARDPRARGSVGAGLVLDVGVRADARWEPRGPPRTRVRSDVSHPLEISAEAARRLRSSAKGSLEIHLTHEVPIGQGFGTSAAGALASSLAIARLLRRSRRDAVEVAHLADYFGRGGLGGVAAILGGGLECRRRPGVPPYGEVLHREFPWDLWVGIVGSPLPSPTILSNPSRLARIERAAAPLREWSRAPGPTEFLGASERFTDQVGLASPRLRSVLRGLRRRGCWAFQAMFGETFVAVPKSDRARRTISAWLTARDLRAVELGTSVYGPRVSRFTR
jgi:pantoate kinase